MKRLFFSLVLIGSMGVAYGKPATPKTKGVQTKSALSFAKSRLMALVKGDVSVEKDIDWGTFTFVSPTNTIKVGDVYKQIPSDKQRASFRRNFITAFGQSFRKQGQITVTTRWRVKKESTARTIVVATGQRGEMELGVAVKSGKMKLISMTLVPKK